MCQQYDIIPILCHRCRWYRWKFATATTPAVPVAKFAPSVVDNGGKFATVSMTPVANSPLVSLILVVHLHLRISPWIFRKIWNDPSVIFGGLGEDDSWKKPEAKSCDTVPLNPWAFIQCNIFCSCPCLPEKAGQLITTEVYCVEVGEVLHIVIRDGAALQLILSQQQNL
jgi:hypothetical protein